MELCGVAWWRQWVFYSCIYATPGLGFDSCCLQADEAHPFTSSRDATDGTHIYFNPCGEFRWSPEGPVSQIHSPHLHVGAPGIFSDLLRSVQMLKREWGAESSGKLPHLFIPSKTEILVPEFAVEDKPLDRISSLGAWVYSERPALRQNTLMIRLWSVFIPHKI